MKRIIRVAFNGLRKSTRSMSGEMNRNRKTSTLKKYKLLKYLKKKIKIGNPQE